MPTAERMRPIGQLDTEEGARIFTDYLFVHDIEAQVEPGKGGAFSVWVVDEDRVAEARALLSRFRSMPDAEEFHQASSVAAERRRGERKEAREEAQKLKRTGDPWRMAGGGVTTILLGLCAAVAFVTRLGESPDWTAWLMMSNQVLLGPAHFWESLVEVSHGQVWRLLTPVLLHFSLWHLVFNMLWMNDLGRVMEDKIGSWRFLAAVVLVALISNLSQYIAGGAGFGGMSGVVYGVFGYLWVRGRLDAEFEILISPLTSGLLLIYLAMGLFGLLGATANAAHFSGLLAGAGLGWGAARRK